MITSFLLAERMALPAIPGTAPIEARVLFGELMPSQAVSLGHVLRDMIFATTGVLSGAHWL